MNKKLEKLLNKNKVREIQDEETEIERNDEIIEQDYLSSLVDQKERLVYYEIENIYSDMDNRKYRNKSKLKKDPPTLIIKDDFDNEAIFYLTENLTDELIETLGEVKRAYYGFSGPVDLALPDKFMDRIIYYSKNKPLKLALPVIIIILTIIFFFK